MTNTYVYRGVSQTKEEHVICNKTFNDNSLNKSLAKTYRGAQYVSLPKETHTACSHTYRGSSYVA
jgi:hypothetical protein